MTDALDPIIQNPPGKLGLFLDFDGVLVAIAPTPDAVEVAPDLPDLLRRLDQVTGGGLAVVSGRPLAEIDRFLENAVPTVFGSHGVEFRVGGVSGTPEPQWAQTAQALTEFAERRFAELDGVLVEPKPAGVAVHYRAAPEARDVVAEAMEQEVARHQGFELMAGKMVFEARPTGLNKGTAVATLMDRPEFSGRTPIFVGDDVTDEDGMRAAMARGGHGIKVGEGESVGRFRLSGPKEVRDFLARLAGMAGSDGSRSQQGALP